MENKELIQVGRSTVGRRGKGGAIVGVPTNILDEDKLLSIGQKVRWHRIPGKDWLILIPVKKGETQ